MWFRNLLIYRLTQAIEFTTEALEQALRQNPARPCGSQELATYGFVAPLGKGADAPLVHHSQGFYLIAARKEERILPGSVITEAVREKVDEIETDQLRKVYKKEREQIKDDIVQAFLPRAFTRKRATFAAIMPAEGLVLINSTSAKQAEDLLSTLRECIGSLPVRPATVKIAPPSTYTDWLKTQKAAPDFHLLDQAFLRDTHEDGGSIAAKHQDLTSEEIQVHLIAGKQVTQLSLAWQDKLSFVIDDGMAISRLRFEDLLQEQASQDGGDDDASQFDASFVLMMLTFRDFLPALLEALGGEDFPQGLGEAPSSGFDSGKRGTDTTLTVVPRGQDQNQIDENADPLYADALKHVRESGRASISSVQRKLLIGYNRAARLIEAMEQAGIVTAMNTNGQREVIRHG